mmetsp:Transcript_45120/g.118349  ORF Transcript_45120/g.118349 Transcript_45120/m.118349 type:complete len:206 (+) Transcript_45120:763-1380(+)
MVVPVPRRRKFRGRGCVCAVRGRARADAAWERAAGEDPVHTRPVIRRPARRRAQQGARCPPCRQDDPGGEGDARSDDVAAARPVRPCGGTAGGHDPASLLLPDLAGHHVRSRAHRRRPHVRPRLHRAVVPAQSHIAAHRARAALGIPRVPCCAAAADRRLCGGLAARTEGISQPDGRRRRRRCRRRPRRHRRPEPSLGWWCRRRS